MDVFPCFMGTQMGLNEKLLYTNLNCWRTNRKMVFTKLIFGEVGYVRFKIDSSVSNFKTSKNEVCGGIGSTPQFGHMRMIFDRIY